jgi:ATP-dependent RNA helicase DDX31/DBP7
MNRKFLDMDATPVSNTGDKSLFSESSFSKFQEDGVLHQDIVRQLAFLGFNQPTRIQELSMKPQCGGKDCLVQSLTGSGKTLAFAVPLLDRIRKLNPPATRADGCYAVVLSPTKELCLQTYMVLTKLVRMMPNIVVGHVAGGDNPKKEKARLRKGLTILCATPGRLVYHLESTASLVTNKLQTLVLDEADRLLDMGFDKQIRQAHQRLVVDQGNKCQVVLVSATLTQKVKSLASWCLSAGSEWISSAAETETEGKIIPKSASGQAAMEETATGQFKIPTRLVQRVAVIDLKFKLVCLVGAILQAKEDKCRRVMIFFSSCASVEFYQALFSVLRWPSFEKYSQPGIGQLPRREIKRMRNEETSIEKKEYKGEKVFTGMSMNILHGDLNTHDRAGAMMDFSKPLNENTKMRVLLCTDVAARGVDISDVDLVIQADPPQQTDEYLHRVGRTARIGNDGNALLFLAPNETQYIEHLRSKCADEVHFAKTSQKGLIAECQRFNPEQVSKLRDFPQFLNSHFAQQVAADEEVDIMARKAFLSSLRAYRTFQGADLREIFNVKDLHGGHLAAAFGLTDCPKTIAISMQQRKKEDFEKRDARQAHHKKRRYEHSLRLRQPKEADPPAKLWKGKVEKPRKMDPKPIKPVAVNQLTAMEFMA